MSESDVERAIERIQARAEECHGLADSTPGNLPSVERQNRGKALGYERAAEILVDEIMEGDD